MIDVAKIDNNFKIETSIKKQGIRFYSIDNPPFCIHGVFKEDGMYRRMPQEVAKKVSDGVFSLHTHTAGGRIRFVTDSPYVALNVKYGGIGRMSHFTLIGSAGFDMYVREDGREIYSGSFIPPYNLKDGFERLIEFKNNVFDEGQVKRREITINMPTYSEVKEVYIGLDENAILEAPSPYINEKPIVYYGHSITQGGCASRPGYVYPSILSRRYHCDFINLGFSGSARGEVEIAEYIAGLDMKMLIYDYDHNAPNAQFLKQTHGRMFDIIRSAQPDLPIIMLTTTPKLMYGGSNDERVAVVYDTYQRALANNDKNVYFIKGSTVCDDSDGPAGATVEGSHLNDIGFQCLANALAEIMDPLIERA